jgi:hypothetical protein
MSKIIIELGIINDNKCSFELVLHLVTKIENNYKLLKFEINYDRNMHMRLRQLLY